ncbi:unnamed protein product [Closterium sp. NIES-53]
MVHFAPCRTTITAEETVRLFISTVVRLHGIPSAINSDRDPKFTSNFWKEMRAQYSMKLQFLSAYHPQTDGQTERTNQTMEQLIRTNCADPARWETSVAMLELAFNNAPSSMTNHSPFFLNYRMDLIVPTMTTLDNPVLRSQTFVIELQEIRKQAANAIRKANITARKCFPTCTQLIASSIIPVSSHGRGRRAEVAVFLAPGPPPVDPLPPQGPAPSGVSQVDAVEPVEVAVDSGAGSGGAEPWGAGSGGAAPGGAESWGAEPGGAESEGAEPGSAEPGGEEPGGAGSARVASRSASSRRELLSPQELREWFARRWSRAAGAGGTPGAAGTGGAAAAAGVGPAGASRAAGAGAAWGVGAGVGPAGGTTGAAGGTGAAGPVGVGAAGASGATSAGAAGGVRVGGSPDAGPSAGAGVGAVGAGSAAGAGAAAGGTGAVPAGSGDPARPRPYFVPLLEQSQSLLQPVSPLPSPSPYTGPTGGLAERREPASRPASPVHTTRASRRAPRPRPPAVPGTHQMTLRPSTASQRVPLPSPPASSLPVLADPESDSLHAASPTIARLLSTVVTDPSFESTAASALVAELVDFAACCRLDYAAGLVAESASVCPPSVGGECALSTDVLEDRQEEFQCFTAALPHLVSMLIAPEGCQNIIAYLFM